MDPSRLLSSPPAQVTATNLFVASTGYHVILAHYIAGNRRYPGPSVLVMKSTRGDFELLYRCVAADPSSPFSDHLFLYRPDEVATIRRGWQRKRLEGLALSQLLPHYGIQRLFISDDVTPGMQILCHRAKKSGIPVFYVEDGGTAYSSDSARISLPKYLKHRILFGPWIENPRAYGLSSLVDESILWFPELARPELRERPIARLPNSDQPVLGCLQWPAQYMKAVNVPPDILDIEVMFTPAYSGLFPDQNACRRAYAQIADAMQADGHRCAVKYHPRESESDWLDLEACGVAILPSSVPVEVVYFHRGEKLLAVYGDAGTALLTARGMLGHARVHSLFDRVGATDRTFRQTLVKAGVMIM